ncbi:hypothetical protein B0H14DRAFT_3148695 [Mycena olivaceomarginata]|nr:hypothetical protein B0H14DRAFT_3148695 [Mycena olivaceomarginata]
MWQFLAQEAANIFFYLAWVDVLQVKARSDLVTQFLDIGMSTTICASLKREHHARLMAGDCQHSDPEYFNTGVGDEIFENPLQVGGFKAVSVLSGKDAEKMLPARQVQSPRASADQKLFGLARKSVPNPSVAVKVTFLRRSHQALYRTYPHHRVLVSLFAVTAFFVACRSSKWDTCGTAAVPAVLKSGTRSNLQRSGVSESDDDGNDEGRELERPGTKGITEFEGERIVLG